MSHAENTGADEREGILTLTPSGAGGDGMPIDITITQIRGSGPLLVARPPVGVDFRSLPAVRGHYFGECGAFWGCYGLYCVGS